MKRCIATIATILTLLPMVARAENVPLPQADALPAAVLMEQMTCTRLWGRAADAERAVAGLSKLPAILTLAQSMDDGTIAPSKEVSISQHAADVPGPTAFLERGETVAACDLMKAAVMISAGDAILALGESAFGSESVFVENINITMRQLGIAKEVANATGANLRLSAWELATIGKAAVESKTFLQYCALFLDSLSHADGRETELVNANRLLKSYTGCSGLMTGSSAEDGYCGVFFAKRNGTPLIAVVLGAPDATVRTKAAMELLDYGFANYRTETVATAGKPIFTDVPVRDGDVKQVDLVPRETVTVVQSGASGKLKQSADMPEYLTAPLDSDVPLCSVTFTGEDGKVAANVPLYPAEAVAAFGVKDILLRIFSNFCT